MPRPKELGIPADGYQVAPTPQTTRRPKGHLVALLALIVFFGSACSATPSWIPVESAEVADPDAIEPASESPDLVGDVTTDDDADAPAELAFVEEEPDPAPSDAFCTASANIWVHSAALNLLGDASTPEMNQIALANVAEWLERSTLFTDEDAMAARADMFAAFLELESMVAADFGFDWAAFHTSSAYANDSAAQSYESLRRDLVTFINDECAALSMRDLRDNADARADELLAEFATEPSTVVESDSLPGHAIFTHSSGRLIASFPFAWDYEEGRSDALVDLIASPDIERFLDGQAIDGVRLQLIPAASLDDFYTLIDATMTGSSCFREVDLADSGAVRINITQNYVCSDHGASIIGQFNESRGLGLIIEASFDRSEPSRADLIRLASIANSALWS